ncbi:MAG TPA: MBL fold metallo-hydrolase [Burkholderiales bacterium]|nr:MBL fold metallo-hydrolase [Burkholderiales bacterium]
MHTTIVPGEVVRIHPRVLRITAPNPGMMTGPGTNSYIIGDDSKGDLALIDPGPDIASHIDLLVKIAGSRLRWILCTHTHQDHSPASRGVKQATGATIHGYGKVPDDGRQDTLFKPERALANDDVVDCGSFKLRAVHTPGHASNHLCYLLEGAGLLFTGDHVMQGSTVVISPPDGDMFEYFASLNKLGGYEISAFAPGHGHVIETPRQEITKLIAHRLKREQLVANALAQAQTATLDELVPVVYSDVSPALHVPARRSLHAHLLKLARDGRAAETDGRWCMLQ